MTGKIAILSGAANEREPHCNTDRELLPGGSRGIKVSLVYFCQRRLAEEVWREPPSIPAPPVSRAAAPPAPRLPPPLTPEALSREAGDRSDRLLQQLLGTERCLFVQRGVCPPTQETAQPDLGSQLGLPGLSSDDEEEQRRGPEVQISAWGRRVAAVQPQKLKPGDVFGYYDWQHGDAPAIGTVDRHSAKSGLVYFSGREFDGAIEREHCHLLLAP